MIIGRIFKIVYYILAFILIVAGILCGIGVYKEMTSKSYVNGNLQGVENIFYTTELNFKTNNVALYEDADSENVFKYETNLTPVKDFDGLKNNYKVVFNDNEIINPQFNSGIVQFVENQEYLNIENDVINETELTIRLEFYADKTKLKVVAKTNNVLFVEQYLQLNGFSLQVIKI